MPNEERSLSVQKALALYEQFLGKTRFGQIKDIELFQLPFAPRIVQMIEESPILWDKHVAYLEQYRSEWMKHQIYKDIVGCLFELHLRDIVIAILNESPSLSPCLIKTGERVIHYEFEKSPPPEIGLEVHTTSPYVSDIEYTEYDQVLVHDENGRQRPVVFEAKVQSKKIDKIVFPELRKYWLNPLAEYYSIFQSSVVVITTSYPHLLRSGNVQRFKDEGGVIAAVPYTSEEFYIEFDKTGLVRKNQ